MTPPSPSTLSDQQISIIIERTNHFVAMANQHFNLALPSPKIYFDIHGSAWGYYVRHNDLCRLRYNPTLFARHFKEGIEDTIPHEVAHYVVDHQYRRHCKPHGQEWREVMRIFGISQPRATHKTPLDGLDIRRQQRYVYYCACGEVPLSATRHNRIVYKGANYICRKCKQTLRPTKTIE